jgi:hypothetical protein
MSIPTWLPNNALVLTLPASGQGRGVGSLRSGTCAEASLRRGAMCHDRGVGGLPRQRSTAPAVGQRRFHIRGELGRDCASTLYSPTPRTRLRRKLRSDLRLI